MTSKARPLLKSNWPDIMEQILRLHSSCVRDKDSPAWTQVKEAGLLMLPRDSIMKQRWTHRPLSLGNTSAIVSNITIVS